ncbi:hypothetical protein BJY52DRAFT_362605 [Lactarius psammicola]|nr:hypothetical protein BJY52DRAFT_362605 [Lactarius psammicola]
MFSTDRVRKGPPRVAARCVALSCVPPFVRTGAQGDSATPNTLRTGYANPARTPYPLRANRCATPAPRFSHAHPAPLTSHTPLRVWCRRRKGGGRCAQGGHTDRGVVQPCPCMRAEAVGCMSGVGRNRGEDRMQTEGCAHGGGALPRARKGEGTCELGRAQPGRGPRANGMRRAPFPHPRAQ